ncbi:hypothetical protein FA95DRAFT_1610739 [Auriscalpium vulgare]|uniref:Uncharacterized protein n=1 Tax=Auriscalpium vulgare TaxID=40419 RepID=A0ACB8RCH0_9AGAM|nr:hypothetical protein FA95DRAFT_1610739 [Auriscalpium vulgare]
MAFSSPRAPTVPHRRQPSLTNLARGVCIAPQLTATTTPSSPASTQVVHHAVVYAYLSAFWPTAADYVAAQSGFSHHPHNYVLASRLPVLIPIYLPLVIPLPFWADAAREDALERVSTPRKPPHVNRRVFASALAWAEPPNTPQTHIKRPCPRNSLSAPSSAPHVHSTPAALHHRPRPHPGPLPLSAHCTHPLHEPPAPRSHWLLATARVESPGDDAQ